MNKKIYLIALVVCFAFGIISGWALRVEFEEYAVAVSDLVILVCAIVVGPIGGIVAGVGATAGELFAGQYFMAIITLVVGVVQGGVCGYLYKYALKDKSIMFGKIVSVSIAVFLSTILCLCGEWLVVMDWSKAITTFIVKTISRVVMAIATLLVLPKIPHIFDKERYSKDLNNG